MDGFARIVFTLGLACLGLTLGCEEIGMPVTGGPAAASAGEKREVADPTAPPEARRTADLVDLGSVDVGAISVRALRSRGAPSAGQELRLVIVVPDDDGTSSVTGWIGTDARFSSAVVGARFSEQFGGYELRTAAPDPLPASASWWIEVQRFDGATHVGSVSLR